MKRLFSLSFIIIGAIIGAGFASGAEILSFFNYPVYIALPLLCLCGLFFYLVFISFLQYLILKNNKKGVILDEQNIFNTCKLKKEYAYIWVF